MADDMISEAYEDSISRDYLHNKITPGLYVSMGSDRRLYYVFEGKEGRLMVDVCSPRNDCFPLGSSFLDFLENPVARAIPKVVIEHKRQELEWLIKRFPEFSSPSPTHSNTTNH